MTRHHPQLLVIAQCPLLDPLPFHQQPEITRTSSGLLEEPDCPPINAPGIEPPAGWRHVQVTDARKRIDFAAFVRNLVDERYKDAIKVVLVMDNLNTHSIASLYEAFEPAEAKRIADKLEIHYTPKHGSWLNMAEIELSVLGRQCLDRRIAEKATLVREVAEWEKARNAAGSRIDWRFTTADARIKLKRLYPVQA